MLRLLVSLLLFPLCLAALDIEPLKKIPPSNSSRYKLIDLGATDVPLEQLSMQAQPLTFAPMINDQRQVIYNQADQGYIKELSGPEAAPQLTRMALCHAINNKGDVLLAVERTPNDILWRIWLQENLRPKGQRSIDLGDLLGRNVFLRTMNDNDMTVGAFKPAGVLRPIIYTPEKGLHHLGYYLGWDITGIALDANNQGTLVGFCDNEGERQPFAWNNRWGLERLKSFPHRWEVLHRCDLQGAVRFDDLLIGDNDLVYGTFHIDPNEQIINNDSIPQYFAFWWDPRSDELRPLSLGGMRLSGVASDAQTFIGSWQGKAALCDIGHAPCLLSDLAPDSVEKEGWTLLEATDSNRHGDIVGYGKRGNETHYFVMMRL